MKLLLSDSLIKSDAEKREETRKGGYDAESFIKTWTVVINYTDSERGEEVLQGEIHMKRSARAAKASTGGRSLNRIGRNTPGLHKGPGGAEGANQMVGT
ncbi:unnamed protein product [Nezara viridula]|uniref:Uncharacterized protein n=1 Tax=Nezara viridula TaxID=85310 RepID=A0A9P0HSC8_NEZVI|nr:unnamed protein product [Nezara viridula]